MNRLRFRQLMRLYLYYFDLCARHGDTISDKPVSGELYIILERVKFATGVDHETFMFCFDAEAIIQSRKVA